MQSQGYNSFQQQGTTAATMSPTRPNAREYQAALMSRVTELENQLTNSRLRARCIELESNMVHHQAMEDGLRLQIESSRRALGLSPQASSPEVTAPYQLPPMQQQPQGGLRYLANNPSGSMMNPPFLAAQLPPPQGMQRISPTVGSGSTLSGMAAAPTDALVQSLAALEQQRKRQVVDYTSDPTSSKKQRHL
eukprot:885431_1